MGTKVLEFWVGPQMYYNLVGNECAAISYLNRTDTPVHVTVEKVEPKPWPICREEYIPDGWHPYGIEVEDDDE